MGKQNMCAACTAPADGHWLGYSTQQTVSRWWARRALIFRTYVVCGAGSDTAGRARIHSHNHADAARWTQRWGKPVAVEPFKAEESIRFTNGAMIACQCLYLRARTQRLGTRSHHLYPPPHALCMGQTAYIDTYIVLHIIFVCLYLWCSPSQYSDRREYQIGASGVRLVNWHTCMRSDAFT